jgi:hypothetical protein
MRKVLRKNEMRSTWGGDWLAFSTGKNCNWIFITLSRTRNIFRVSLLAPFGIDNLGQSSKLVGGTTGMLQCRFP